VEPALLQHAPKRALWAQEMGLPNHLVDSLGTQPGGERGAKGLFPAEELSLIHI